MFSSITTTPESQDERVPKTSLLPVWVGFIPVAIIFIVAFTIGLLEATENGDFSAATPFLLLIAVADGIYWLFCVHRFHKVLEELSNSRYPISPAEAVWKHFIPFYNFVWVFRWPAAISEYVNERGRVNMASGAVLGVFMLLSMLMRFVDSAIGLAGMFAIAMYISVKLKRHVESLQTPVASNVLPPPPDKDLFGYVPTTPRENSTPSS
jgi:hypothetical protein